MRLLPIYIFIFIFGYWRIRLVIVQACWLWKVSDVENILGLLQTEVIQVHAEAYDVALDMTFPKG